MTLTVSSQYRGSISDFVIKTRSIKKPDKYHLSATVGGADTSFIGRRRIKVYLNRRVDDRLSTSV